MGRNFHLSIPKRRSGSYPEITPPAKSIDYDLPQLPSPFVESLLPDGFDKDIPPLYDLLPTKDQFYQTGVNIYLEENRNRWIDHRQQYGGRAIAKGLHTRKIFAGRDGDSWKFYALTVENRGNARFAVWNPYFVHWDGVGDPWDLGLPDPSTDSRGSFMMTQYTWAVFFLVNGTFDDVWNPLPDSSWPYGLEWWDYPVS